MRVYRHIDDKCRVDVWQVNVEIQFEEDECTEIYMCMYKNVACCLSISIISLAKCKDKYLFESNNSN